MGLFRKVQKIQDMARPRCAVIVAAAGHSVRMGQDKLFMELGGVPVLQRTLNALDQAELVSQIVVAASEENLLSVADLCSRSGLRTPIKVVKGGATRAESVLCAAVECEAKTELIAVHDGARPLITPAQVDEMIRWGHKTMATAPAVPVTDTVKVADENGRVISTPDRKTLFAVQTPQVFQADLLKAALQSALAAGVQVTDDCGAVERIGKEVYLVPGDPGNIKITAPLDIAVAEAILRQRGQLL